MGDNAFFDLIQDRAMEKGRAEGRAEEARRALLRVLARRFGGVPEDLRARLDTVEDLERLERFLDEAVLCVSLDDFQDMLDAAG